MKAVLSEDTPAAQVWVARLALTDYRSYRRLDLDLDARPVCLVGKNGAGKTNILEALSMLGPGKGLRNAALPDLASRLGPSRAWAVAAEIERLGDRRTIGVGVQPDADGNLRRSARVDGRSVGPGELARALGLLWVTPAMDRVWAGPTGDRRRLFDRLVFAHAPEHGQTATAYERAMRERQRLLDEGTRDPKWLASLEAEMAAHGVAMAAARIETLRLLQAAIDSRPDGAFPKADLSLEGPLEANILANAPAVALEDKFAADLARNRPRDAAARRALDGPHRTDFRARHRQRDMPAAECSTGEQKALLIGLILANARALGERPGAANPLLLLDEATAHLDAERRGALADEIAALGGQAWLTGVEQSLFEAFGRRTQTFEIRDGFARRL